MALTTAAVVAAADVFLRAVMATVAVVTAAGQRPRPRHVIAHKVASAVARGHLLLVRRIERGREGRRAPGRLGQRLPGAHPSKVVHVVLLVAMVVAMAVVVMVVVATVAVVDGWVGHRSCGKL